MKPHPSNRTLFIAQCSPPIISLFLFCLLLPCKGSTVVSEDYEDKIVGYQQYSGDWTFVHADAAYSTTTVSLLNIDNGPVPGISWGTGYLTAPDSLASPAGGNYLSYSVGDGWWYEGDGVSITTGDPVHGTINPWESSAGHFYREMKLDAGTTYSVGLWRQIQVSSVYGPGAGGGGGGDNLVGPQIGFSVWNAAGLDQANPQLANRIAFQDYPFDPAVGGWQRVDLTFTTTGQIGDPQVDIAFTMGLYSPTTPPALLTSDDPDGNPRTAEWDFDDYNATSLEFYRENSRYSIDGFELSVVPEPGSLALVVASLAGAAFRRRRFVPARGSGAVLGRSEDVVRSDDHPLGEARFR